MRALFVFFCFLPCLWADYSSIIPKNVVQEFVRKNANFSADPCDDFYAHVCPKQSEATVLSEVRQMKKDIIKEYIRSNPDNATELVNARLSRFDRFDVKSLVEDAYGWRELCLQNETLVSLFTHSVTIMSVERSLQHGVLKYLESLSCEGKLKFVQSIESPGHSYSSSLSVLRQSQEDSVFHMQFEEEDQSVRALFEILKIDLSKQLKKTRSTMNNEVVEILERKLQSLSIATFSDLNEGIQNAVKVFYDSKEACMDLISTKYYNQKLFCKVIAVGQGFHALKSLTDKMDENADRMISWNPQAAFNSDNEQVYIGTEYLLLAKTGHLSDLFGSLGFYIAHEIFDSLDIKHIDTEQQKPLVSFMDSRCVGDQFLKTCQTFQTTSSVTACNIISTYEQNTEELAGYRLVWDVLEKTLYESLEKKQFVFYSTAVLHCHTDVYYMDHQRINSLMSQMDQFADAFKCKPTDKMIMNKGRHCDLFGSNDERNYDLGAREWKHYNTTRAADRTDQFSNKMRSKVRYQLLDPSSAPKTCRFLWLFLFLIACFIAYFLLFSTPTKGVFNELVPDGKNPITYEQVMNDLRNEIDQRNAIINELQKDFKNREVKSELKTLYRRRPETEHVDCGRILSGDKPYLETVSGKNRVKIVENDNLDMSCAAIMSRILPPNSVLKPLKNGVAFARIVYADYEMIEKQVQMSYHPQNAFCFAIDKKAPPKFHERLRAMAACLPNILLLPDEESVDSAGHNINLAHYNCMRVLINKPGWNYVILLQNHDLITKSVYELEQIYEWLGGANDIEITPESGRINRKYKWDPISLKMFRNESAMNPTVLNNEMKFAKGAAQGSLSREAVDWMVRTTDLTTYIDQWNKGGFGVDEQFIQSFQVSAELGMPGHFTDECLKQGKNTDFVSRMSQWMYGGADLCGSKTIRHAICLLGIEDFRTLAAYPNVMFNKMIPSFDYSIVECSAELLFNRTFLGQEDHKLEEDYYTNMVNVLYHKNHLDPNFKLICTPTYKQWSHREYPL